MTLQSNYEYHHHHHHLEHAHTDTQVYLFYSHFSEYLGLPRLMSGAYLKRNVCVMN